MSPEKQQRQVELLEAMMAEVEAMNAAYGDKSPWIPSIRLPGRKAVMRRFQHTPEYEAICQRRVTLQLLIEAHERGEDIVMAKLSMDRT